MLRVPERLKDLTMVIEFEDRRIGDECIGEKALVVVVVGEIFDFEATKEIASVVDLGDPTSRVEEAVACGSDGIKRCDSRIGMTIRLGGADEGVVELAEFPHDFVFAVDDDRIERVGEEDEIAIDVFERPRDDLELLAMAGPILIHADYRCR